MLLTKIERNIPLKEGGMEEALTGDLTFLECTVYLQSYTQVSKLLYFIGVGFGGLEAMNSMAGFGGVGRMGGK